MYVFHFLKNKKPKNTVIDDHKVKNILEWTQSCSMDVLLHLNDKNK